jgi:amidohydrolase
VFVVTIRGKVPYGPTPQFGVDTIVVAAECVSALQSIKNRRIDPLEPALLTIGSIHGGDRPFNTPAEVELQGSLRAFSEDARHAIEQLMRQTLAGVTSAYGATYDLKWSPVTAVVVNDPKLVAEALPSLRRAVGSANVLEIPWRMGGEDFAYYGRVVPGFLFRLGSGNSAKGIIADAHTAAFDIDEDCLVVGVKALATVVVDFLDQHSGRQ